MSRLVPWLLSSPASIFYCLAAAALHESIGSPSGAPAIVAALSTYFLASSIATCIVSDARRHQRSIPYDFDSFIFFAWWVLAPTYLFSTRGWRGFIPIAWFLVIYLAAAVFGVILSLLHTFR
jgi:hypothetical protein